MESHALYGEPCSIQWRAMLYPVNELLEVACFIHSGARNNGALIPMCTHYNGHSIKMLIYFSVCIMGGGWGVGGGMKTFRSKCKRDECTNHIRHTLPMKCTCRVRALASHASAMNAPNHIRYTLARGAIRSGSRESALKGSAHGPVWGRGNDAQLDVLSITAR